MTASLSAGKFTAGTGTLASNYTLPTTASGAGAISPAAVTATIIGKPTRAYDGTTNAALTAANFSLSGVLGGQSLTVTQTAGTYNSANVVSVTTVTASLPAGSFTAGTGTLASNYVLSPSASGSGAINPVPITAAIIGTPTRPYDGTPNANLTPANFSLSGVASGQSFTVTQDVGTYNSANVTSASTVAAGLSTGSFTAGTGTLASNYTLPSSASGAGAISPAIVSAAVIGTPTRPYDGTPNATLTAASIRLSGVPGGQSFTVTLTTGTWPTSRERGFGDDGHGQPAGGQHLGGRRDTGEQLRAADLGQRPRRDQSDYLDRRDHRHPDQALRRHHERDPDAGQLQPLGRAER